MAERLKSWLDDKHAAYNYRTLTAEELRVVWRANRNSMEGSLAAEEVMRRVDEGTLRLREVDRVGR